MARGSHRVNIAGECRAGQQECRAGLQDAGALSRRCEQNGGPKLCTACGVANKDAVVIHGSGGQLFVKYRVLQRGGGLPDGCGQPIEDNGGVGEAVTAGTRDLAEWERVHESELIGYIGC